jgi:hypothetical protein
MTPSAETLFAFARSHQRATFLTLRRESPFRVEVVGNFLEITPDSSSAPRRESHDSVAAVLGRLGKTMSFQTSDYQDLSFNASYVLALVKSWQSPERLVSTDFDRIVKSDESASKTGKNVKGLPEHIARELMAEYYKNNKATLSASVREHREVIVQLIMEGLSPAQAFCQGQATGARGDKF